MSIDALWRKSRCSGSDGESIVVYVVSQHVVKLTDLLRSATAMKYGTGHSRFGVFVHVF